MAEKPDHDVFLNSTELNLASTLQQAEARLSTEVPTKHDFNKFTFQCHIKKMFHLLSSTVG